jgi:hypothetical protein
MAEETREFALAGPRSDIQCNFGVGVFAQGLNRLRKKSKWERSSGAKPAGAKAQLVIMGFCGTTEVMP